MKGVSCYLMIVTAEMDIWHYLECHVMVDFRCGFFSSHSFLQHQLLTRPSNETLHQHQTMLFESAASLRTAIDTADAAIRNSIRDGTLADVLPRMKHIFVSLLYSMLVF